MNLDVSSGRMSRIWLTEAPGKYHYGGQQPRLPVHSPLVTGHAPGVRVADLGCGPGTFLADLTERVSSPASVRSEPQPAVVLSTAGAVTAFDG